MNTQAPNCPRCDSTEFELTAGTLTNSARALDFVQCVGCGVVVGTLDRHDPSKLLHRLARRLGHSLDS